MPKPTMQTTRTATAPTSMQSFAREDSANFGMGILFGFFAAIVGACVWALVSALTGYQIGWLAIAVGFATGWAVRTGGKGTSTSFGIMGACLALFGCMLGNLLTSCIFISQQVGAGFFDILLRLDGGTITEIFTETFQPMDILFYCLAIYAGFKYSTQTTAGKSPTK